MNLEKKMNCTEIHSLLVKKIADDLVPEEKRSVERHLAECASCAAEERSLAMIWQEFEGLPVREIPTELYQKTRGRILIDLKSEKSLSPWLAKIPPGPWRALVPIAAGLATTAISYGLIHRLVDPRVHHPYFLIPLFSLWWLLYVGGFWLILKGKGERSLRLDLVSARSISCALLALLISFLTYESEFLRWLAVSAAYDLAVVSNYVFGTGNTFVAAWWIHCCLASFIGTFIFGFSRSRDSSENLFIGSFVVTIFLSPAMYLQGSSHNHGFGLIAFAALGAYVGSLVGMGLGLFIRRHISFQAA
ncbi:MAG: zf-HC2 domain-containing protein [Candidatus Binatia bacterium]|nr:zf-HC2 domain-containing protein [Candidatus Binatia bacterium]